MTLILVALLGATQLLGVAARLYGEVWQSPRKVIFGLLILALLWFSRRSVPILLALLLVLGLCITRQAGPLQTRFSSLTGLLKKPVTQRFYCSGRVMPQNAHVYRVTHQASGSAALMLVGKSYKGEPVMCGATPEYFPVMSLASVEIHEQADLSHDEALQKVMENPSALIGRLTGHVALLFIPSLKATTFRIPFEITDRQLRVVPGYHRADEVAIQLLR